MRGVYLAVPFTLITTYVPVVFEPPTRANPAPSSDVLIFTDGRPRSVISLSNTVSGYRSPFGCVLAGSTLRLARTRPCPRLRALTSIRARRDDPSDQAGESVIFAPRTRAKGWAGGVRLVPPSPIAVAPGPPPGRQGLNAPGGNVVAGTALCIGGKSVHGPSIKRLFLLSSAMIR